jgi:hypothetical protein
MTLLRTSWAAVRAAALARVGHSRKTGDADWTNSTVIDDCARFCSSMLWGGTPGPISWVDNFKTATDGTYHAGAAGLREGDVVLFDWDHNGVGNHVEFCYTAPNVLGAFTTIGANGSDTVAVKIRSRLTYWILGYFRPAYGELAEAGSSTPAPLPAKAPAPAVTTSQNGDDMFAAQIVSKSPGSALPVGAKFTLDVGRKLIVRVDTGANLSAAHKRTLRDEWNTILTAQTGRKPINWTAANAEAYKAGGYTTTQTW